jgi:hypothetical protein
MTCYVDDMKAQFGSMVMCHLVADSHEELLAMATTIGVDHKWIQKAGTAREHFDIALSKRALAVKAGAKEITWKQLGAMCCMRARVGELGTPHDAIERYAAWRAANDFSDLAG